MYSKIMSGCMNGMQAGMICVEVDVSNGLPGISMVGSLSCEVKEAKERVMVALKNTGYSIPPKKITVNLSPVNMRKEGNGLDLPIAIGILQSMECIPREFAKNTLFLGELGLNGEIKPIHGVLPLVREAMNVGMEECILPLDNLEEGSAIPGIRVVGATNLKELVDYLKEQDESIRKLLLPSGECNKEEILSRGRAQSLIDFSDVLGQEGAKRAALIAASGFHNLLMVGPPGGGKSMIAKRIPSILPPLSWEECMEISSIHSVAGKLSAENPFITSPPFQSPHHTLSAPAFVGGGSRVRPGIISLAHRGVLFLDELTEFPKSILEDLRQPLEDHVIHIARAGGDYQFPCNFMLVCAMNPCKCGYYPDKNRCHCTSVERNKYWGKLSGPLLERIDMCVETSRVDILSLQKRKGAEKKEDFGRLVENARKAQKARFEGTKYRYNGDVKGEDIEKYCFLDKGPMKMMEMAYASFGLSARVYHKVLKVARTIADLQGEENITEEHLMEALSYRFQKEQWIRE